MPSREFDLQGPRSADAEPRPSFLAGVGLLAAGLAIIALVFYLGDTSEPGGEHIYFALGLTGMALLSLTGQVVGTIGLVMLWHWWRRGRA